MKDVCSELVKCEHVYSVACGFEGGFSKERVIGFHGNITRVPPYMGLFECNPYLLTVIPEK